MSTTTVRTKAADIYKDWHVIDAAGRPLGRVATEAAHLLRGKHKPIFEPHLDVGDFVIIINASQVKVGGKKAEQKLYHRHSGFPGGLKTRSFEQLMATFPERILEKAVWGMLPSGALGKQMLKHLKVYRGPSHPHQSQITGSERAREAREAGLAEAIEAAAAKKPRRLRPLSVPQGEAAPGAPASATAVAQEAPPVAAAPETAAEQPAAVNEEPTTAPAEEEKE